MAIARNFFPGNIQSRAWDLWRCKNFMTTTDEISYKNLEAQSVWKWLQRRHTNIRWVKNFSHCIDFHVFLYIFLVFKSANNFFVSRNRFLSTPLCISQRPNYPPFICTSIAHPREFFTTSLTIGSEPAPRGRVRVGVCHCFALPPTRPMGGASRPRPLPADVPRRGSGKQQRDAIVGCHIASQVCTGVRDLPTARCVFFRLRGKADAGSDALLFPTGECSYCRAWSRGKLVLDVI